MYIRSLTDEEKHAYFMAFMYYDGLRDPIKWLAEDMIYELHNIRAIPVVIVKREGEQVYKGTLKRLE